MGGPVILNGRESERLAKAAAALGVLTTEVGDRAHGVVILK